MSTLAQGFTSSMLTGIAVNTESTIFVSGQMRVSKLKEGGTAVVHVGDFYPGVPSTSLMLRIEESGRSRGSRTVPTS